MALAFLPLYVHLLGLEAFGLVGVMLSLQAILQVFDFGIGGATNRELSRRVQQNHLAASCRSLVRTSEAAIWALALASALLVWVGSGWFAGHWLQLGTLTQHEAQQAIACMGVAIALMWPSVFYGNCLSGLERQPLLNAINAASAVLRYAGVVPVLWWLSPSIGAFFVWQALVGALQSLATAWAVWRVLPLTSGTVQWQWAELRASRQFAFGLFAVGLLALAVTQMDRLVLTRMRPLEDMGAYTLALSVSAGLSRMVQPMFNALYPRLSRLVARGDAAALSELYHLSSQYLAVVVAAVAAILMVFARDVLFLWTGDATLADRVALPLMLLVAGSAMNGLLNIPYALQLACGWTRLALGLNVAALLLGLPLCYWAVGRWGLAGAALPWVLGNAISVVVGLPLMHRRLLPGELARWLLRDNVPSLAAGFAVALGCTAVLPGLPRSGVGLVELAAASAATFAACVVAAPLVREALWRSLRRLW